MLDLQLATTLVNPTGTGLLYVAYEQGPDSAVWKNGSGATRSVIALRRVQAKPTPTFPGVERFELNEYVSVGAITTSIPVVIGSSDRTAFFTNLALLGRDPILSNAISTGQIPT
jgi:hypothetical protein